MPTDARAIIRRVRLCTRCDACHMPAMSCFSGDRMWRIEVLDEDAWPILELNVGEGCLEGLDWGASDAD